MQQLVLGGLDTVQGLDRSTICKGPIIRVWREHGKNMLQIGRDRIFDDLGSGARIDQLLSNNFIRIIFHNNILIKLVNEYVHKYFHTFSITFNQYASTLQITHQTRMIVPF